LWETKFVVVFDKAFERFANRNKVDKDISNKSPNLLVCLYAQTLKKRPMNSEE
jgi:hypothetical protein